MEPATAARLRHLNDAAHALNYAAPSTAAFLQSSYNKLLEEEDTPIPDLRAREICGACGYNMLWNPEYPPATLEPESKQRKKPNDSKEGVKKTVLSCHMCHSRTQFNLPMARRTRRSTKHRHSTQPADPSFPAAITASSESSSAGSIPRKRAKGRKQQSLQAMLAKSKAEAAAEKPGFGLDLMDLMKGAL